MRAVLDVFFQLVDVCPLGAMEPFLRFLILLPGFLRSLFTQHLNHRLVNVVGEPLSLQRSFYLAVRPPFSMELSLGVDSCHTPAQDSPEFRDILCMFLLPSIMRYLRIPWPLPRMLRYVVILRPVFCLSVFCVAVEVYRTQI